MVSRTTLFNNGTVVTYFRRPDELPYQSIISILEGLHRPIARIERWEGELFSTITSRSPAFASIETLPSIRPCFNRPFAMQLLDLPWPPKTKPHRMNYPANRKLQSWQIHEASTHIADAVHVDHEFMTPLLFTRIFHPLRAAVPPIRGESVPSSLHPTTIGTIASQSDDALGSAWRLSYWPCSCHLVISVIPYP